MIKHSRQRDAILLNLSQRYDHPTAEMVYFDIKEQYPNISLGTVYRNLSLLAELGEIQKISTGVGPDRFDGNPAPHYHFFCSKCGSVIDLEMEGIDHINILASSQFDGKLMGTLPISTGSAVIA